MANLSNINNKFIVTDGGNVLIGQTSAIGSSIFQVTGTSTFAGEINVKNASTRFISLNYEDGINSIISHSGTSYGLESLNVRGDKIYFYTDYEAGVPKGDITLTLENSHNAKFEGNVGIGISPGATSLHIYKSDATALIQASNTSGIAQVQFFPRDASNVAHLQSIKGVDSNLTFLTGGNSGNSYVPTEKMRITSGARINMDVMAGQASEGVIRIGRYDVNTTRYNEIQNSVTSTGAGSYMNLSVHSGTENVVTDVMTLLGDGNVGIGVSPITSPNSADKSLSIFSGQDCSIILKDNVETWEIYQNDDLQFSFGTTPTTVMTMQRTTGNILIGAVNADIGGSVTGIRFNQAGSILASIDETADSSFVSYFDRRGTNNEGSVIAFAMGGFFKSSIGVIGTNANVDDGGITFNTLATVSSTFKSERMRINNSGDVGIGTTPETAGPTWRTLFIGASATIVSRQAAAGYDSIFANNYYINSSNQDRVRTTGPSSRMFLDGNNIRFQISPSTGVGGSPTWSEIMRVDDSGRVGIGTTSPTEKLEVKGNIRIDSRSKAGSGEIDKLAFTKDRADAGTGTYEMGEIRSFTTNGYSGGMTFYCGRHTGGGGYGLISTMTIGHTTEIGLANVGIGTTIPSAKLMISDANNRGFSDAQFKIEGSGYTAAHYLDGSAYYIHENSTIRDIRIITHSNGVKLTPGATAWVSNSDISLKENLKPLDNVLDKIKNYRCVEYNLKNAPDDKKIGFIAQDWKNDFAPIVDKDNDGLLGMKYTETIPVLLKAIQELEARIKILENK